MTLNDLKRTFEVTKTPCGLLFSGRFY